MEGDPRINGYTTSKNISIHSLRMEGDRIAAICRVCQLIISIHSLRMEGDSLPLLLPYAYAHFNPLPPHGGRHGY